ncbi:MAG: RNA 2',3'-cyclic phosphodiesterase [bacterium]
MMRLFIGLELSIAVTEKLVLIQDELARVLPKDVDIRFVAPERIHVTLKFIGETPEEMVPVIATRVAEMARPLFPFEFKAVGFGAFPALDNARIVWAGLDAQSAEVMDLLRQTLERELEAIGIVPDDREYRPHVTLGRMKSAKAVNISEWAAQLADTELGASYVRDIILFASDLGKEGAEYRVLQRFALGES